MTLMPAVKPQENYALRIKNTESGKNTPATSSEQPRLLIRLRERQGIDSISLNGHGAQDHAARIGVGEAARHKTGRVSRAKVAPC